MTVPAWKVIVSKASPLTIALLLLVLFLWPTLHLPYLGDDMFNAYIDGWIGYEHLSTREAFLQFLGQQPRGGRFYPFFSVLVFGVFHYEHSLAITKALVLVAIVVNALTLYLVLRMLAPKLALLTIVLLPATWQIRWFHDPIIQFSLHMQLALEFVLLALIGLALFVRKRQGRYLAMGSIAYACACLTYEPTYAYALLFVTLALILIPTASRRALAIAAFTIPMLACASVAFSYRAYYALSATDQHAIHATLGPVFATFGIQGLGALPLTYRVFNPRNVFATYHLSLHVGDVLIALIAFAAIYLACSLIPRSHVASPGRAREPRHLIAAVLVAALAWLLPGIVIAFSPRWQVDLAPGLAYLPVYFAEPAVAIILAASAYALTRTLPSHIGRYAVPILGALVIATTYRANAFAMTLFAPRNMTVPNALDAGLLPNASDGDVVYLDSSYPAHEAMWVPGPANVKYYLYHHTGKRLIPMPMAMLPSRTPAHAFILLGVTEGFDRGTVIAGRIAGVASDRAREQPLVVEVERYVREPDRPPVLTIWASRCGPVRADAVLRGVLSALTLEYAGPFSVQEHDEFGRWRWASGDASIEVMNPTDRARTARVRFSIRAVKNGRIISATGPGVDVQTSFAGKDINVTATLPLAAHTKKTIALHSNGSPVVRPPDIRPLLFQIRNATLEEPACNASAP